MITPAPISPIAPSLARGTLHSISPGANGAPASIVMAFTGTSYEIRLVAAGPVTAGVGKRLVGTIRARARRIDVVSTGGKFVEPVMGRPRRVQGVVIAIDAEGIVVDAGMPIHVTPTDARQAPGSFSIGQLVAFDALEGATFQQG